MGTDKGIELMKIGGSISGACDWRDLYICSIRAGYAVLKLVAVCGSRINTVKGEMRIYKLTFAESAH